jgi:hypothetical protein
MSDNIKGGVRLTPINPVIGGGLNPNTLCSTTTANTWVGGVPNPNPPYSSTTANTSVKPNTSNNTTSENTPDDS